MLNNCSDITNFNRHAQEDFCSRSFGSSLVTANVNPNCKYLVLKIIINNNNNKTKIFN